LMSERYREIYILVHPIYLSSVFRGEGKKRGAILAILLLKKERRRTNEIF